MKYYEVAPNRIVRAGSDSFTYASSTPLQVGQIVRIPVGKQPLNGIVLEETTKPDYTTKEVDGVIEQTPLPQSLVKLARWLADYYKTPLATVLQTLLPRGLEKTRRGQYTTNHQDLRNRTKIVFNKAQSDALEVLNNSGHGSYVLQGVTGSGKTEIYKEIARQTIASGKSVILLVPEISLTSQLISEFIADFPTVIVTHSRMTEAERHLAWREALTSREPRVVIGPRSALFMPVPKLGAVLVDEAHEPSYKQEQSPRYSALRAATMLGKFTDSMVIFGSATPSVADRYLSEQANRGIIRLDTPARLLASKPTITLVDMTKRDHFRKHRFLSDTLLQHIEKNLQAGKQTLIFHNRRGSASTTLCENCGWTALCPNCLIPLVLHTDTFSLSCHICNHQEKVPTACPTCRATDVIHRGIGTKLVETELTKLFPKATIARFDSDTKADETIEKRYKDLYDGTIDIAIGTQVVAKGLDLPHLRTVGVIQADSGLSLPDYAAAERTFQLLTQVIGRVGRDEHASEVIVQSYQPAHPIIQFGLNQDYDGFYTYMINERKQSGFPPFRHLLQLTVTYKSESGAVRAAQSLSKTLKEKAHKDVRILGPTPAFYERTPVGYRWQLTVKSPRREHLVALLSHLPPSHWQYELDPASLL